MGGLLAHLGLLADGLRRAGHDVVAVLSPDPGAEPAAVGARRAGARVERCEVRGRADAAGMRALARLVARERPEVFHLHLSSPVEGVPALLAARWAGARALVTTEHAPTWAPLRRFYSRSVKRLATRLLRAVVAVCESDSCFLSAELGVPRRLIRVIPNGVPAIATPPKEEARARLGLPAGAAIVGYVGALEAKKGVEDLLEAARLCGPPRPAVALAGRGGLEAALRARSAASSCPVFLLGHVDDVPAFLGAVDLFVLPSHQEALPLALLEAMRAGLPIVATRVGGVPEAVRHEETGLLVAPGRPDALAAAIGRLAVDAGLARRLGAAAKAEAGARVSAGAMVARTAALYAEVA